MFFKKLFEQAEIIQQIQYIKPLLKWSLFIFNKYNAQLTLEDANDQTIQNIIDRENQNHFGNDEYLKKVNKHYDRFESAWNHFAGLIIRDGLYEAAIPHISRDSKLILCCLTSNPGDNHDGYILFMLLKYLAL
jgi:hypothetical protein